MNQVLKKKAQKNFLKASSFISISLKHIFRIQIIIRISEPVETIEKIHRFFVGTRIENNPKLTLFGFTKNPLV